MRKMEYIQIMHQFLEQSIKVGEAIKEDYAQAAALFKALQKDANFESLIAQRGGEAQHFMDECKSFAVAIEHWSEEYPILLRDFKAIMEAVIGELQSIKGFEIKYNDQKIEIGYNEKEFLLGFRQDHPSQEGQIFIPETLMKEIGKSENRIVQEIAEIIALDLQIKKFMEYMDQLNREHDIPEKARAVLGAKDVNSPILNQSMHSLADWWFKVNKVLEALSKATHKAVEMDRKAAKKLQKMFATEASSQIREKKLEAVKGGLIAVAKIAVNIIPGGGLLQAIWDAKEVAQLTRQSLKALEDAQRG